MVSNEEISRRLRDRREGKPLNCFLVCNSCGGYYKLQQGESPEDFNWGCDCGGQLIKSPTETLSNFENRAEKDKFLLHILISYFLIWFFWPAAAIGAYYLLTRDNERANFHGKIITVICIVGFLFTAYILLFFFYIMFMSLQVSSLHLFLPCF